MPTYDDIIFMTESGHFYLVWYVRHMSDQWESHDEGDMSNLPSIDGKTLFVSCRVHLTEEEAIADCVLLAHTVRDFGDTPLLVPRWTS